MVMGQQSLHWPKGHVLFVTHAHTINSDNYRVCTSSTG